MKPESGTKEALCPRRRAPPRTSIHHAIPTQPPPHPHPLDSSRHFAHTHTYTHTDSCTCRRTHRRTRPRALLPRPDTRHPPHHPQTSPLSLFQGAHGKPPESAGLRRTWAWPNSFPWLWTWDHPLLIFLSSAFLSVASALFSSILHPLPADHDFISFILIYPFLLLLLTHSCLHPLISRLEGLAFGFLPSTDSYSPVASRQPQTDAQWRADAPAKVTTMTPGSERRSPTWAAVAQGWRWRLRKGPLSSLWLLLIPPSYPTAHLTSLCLGKPVCLTPPRGTLMKKRGVDGDRGLRLDATALFFLHSVNSKLFVFWSSGLKSSAVTRK